ncbi:MAG: UMP kinase [Planctomycetota bacterium]
MDTKRRGYQRVLLKISGEVLVGGREFGIDPAEVESIAHAIKELRTHSIQVAVVIGGGNFIRGAEESARGMDRAVADYMGMLATLLNGMALQDGVEKLGMDSRLCSALNIPEVCESYIRRKCLSHFEKGRVVILAGGTGNPYFTTDTAAALRGAELGVDAILKGTKVDGIYDRDPVKHKDSKRFDRLSYMDYLRGQYKVMDQTAVTLCQENNLPIVVFNLHDKANILKAALGEPVGTLVGKEAGDGH